ncbi:hypothetical protein Sme01_69320 [Sphaerisporangium melleum]|uniref:Class IV aminotransferase n=1 Tax=Sphaerisporangium melleum TaxID=321316 RepID=A0A917RLI4_9ACTN|nr:hypothetical protein GCM10007964_63210 [Sphaerisporangium melleum]GII74456.1 hypothetical protein Sme01_69320 [Sphaerisporangium melleum]
MIDGHPPTVEDLLRPALRNYGHFTAMQVRDGATRGLDLHLRRLDTATAELFGQGLDGDLVRHRVRHALAGGARDASVRVYVFPRDEARGGGVSILVSVAPPHEPPAAPQSLLPVAYQRPAAHLKHVGGFGQSWAGRAAERAGFDEALLVAQDGTVAEGAITNIGFWDGEAVVWPEAPMLTGITMMLLDRGLAALGVPVRRRPLRLADLGSFRGAFLTNSWGIMPVGRIGEVTFPGMADPMARVREAYESNPWEPI